LTIALSFLGGAGTVTGSMHLVSTDDSDVLLDCGLFYGHRDEYYEINANFPFLPANLDACVLSHAHIDHCGNIPNLVKKGFRKDIHCTPATRDLCRYMLADSGFVQEEDVKYVNKINKKRGLPPRKPLYNKKDAEKSLKYLRALEYHRPFSITRDINLNFYEAGHILGSAVSVLEIGTSKGKTRLGYAVDLGRFDMPLLKDPESPKDIDYLIIESTYGARVHGSLSDAGKALSEVINRTAKRGGKVIIPSFALERTQLIVFFISQLMKKKKVPKLPIYVDGPLAVNLTKVFRENWMYFDETTRQSFMNDEDPLGYDNITYVKRVSESKRLNDVKRPVIIISGSGMCENGRILHHLKNNIENPRNTIIVIGFMAGDTLGRGITEKKDIVRIFGRPFDLNAEVQVINAFSSHADKNGLIDYVRSLEGRLKRVFIVHGESEQSESLRREMKKRLNIRVNVPSRGETVYLKTV